MKTKSNIKAVRFLRKAVECLVADYKLISQFTNQPVYTLMSHNTETEFETQEKGIFEMANYQPSLA